MLEVRADRVGDLEPAWLRDRFPGTLLYTLRSEAEGGAAVDGGLSGADRDRRLVGAAEAGYDLVDLEVERDLHPAVLDAIPARSRVLSWHGGPRDAASGLQALQRRFHGVAETRAALYKFAFRVEAPGQELAPLALLRSLQRPDFVAFGIGPIASWTRLVAPHLGAPVVFAAAGSVAAAPGQFTLERLVEDYGLPRLPELRRLFGIVGHPVHESLSPRLHNGAYRELGLDALYVPFHVESFGEFWLEVVESGSLTFLGCPLGGLSVTAPHKRIAQAVAGASSPLCERVGSANTLVLHGAELGGVWEADTTDPEGVLQALAVSDVAVPGRRVAVVGAGGAGRAAAYGLAAGGGRVALVNRGSARGRRAAEELDLPFVRFEEFEPERFDILVNATPLGRGDDDPLPFEPGDLSRDAVVVDLAYRRDGRTKIVAAVEESGRRAVDGREVLLQQAFRQFSLMTGRELPGDGARRALSL